MARKLWIPSVLALCGLFYAGVAAAAASGSKSYVQIQANAWSTDVSGTLYNTNPSSSQPETHIDLNSDLGLSRHTNGGFTLDIHHSVPILPDFLLEYDYLVNDGSNNEHRDITYNGVVYVANGRLISQTVLKQARMLLYWNLVDNSALDLRAGLGARWENLHMSLAGTVEATDPQGGTQTEQGSARAGGVRMLPMVNLGAIVHLPAGFDLFGEASYISYASSYFFDTRAGVDVHFPIGLVLNVGYRRLKLRLNNTAMDINGDIDYKGPYAGLAWRF